MFDFLMRNVLLKNIFRTKHKKRCLFIFITPPFLFKDKMKKKHVNYYEAIYIADILNQLHYSVDVIDYRHDICVNYKPYDLIIGIGEGFDKSFDKNFSGKRIFYATGACFLYSSVAAFRRSYNLMKRKGVFYEPERLDLSKDYVKRIESLMFCNGILCVGNKWTMETYSSINENIFSCGALGFHSYDFSNIKRNVEDAKRSFLFFTGSGMVHKGLDVCVEAFSKMPSCELYIVGNYEESFFEVYKEELNLPNIHFKGFVFADDEKYKDICEKCCYTLCLSCSEGICTSVITTMFTGLIPIVTLQSGVDIGDFGYMIENMDVDYVVSFISKIVECESTKNIVARMERVYCNTADKYSDEAFINKVRQGIVAILENDE